MYVIGTAGHVDHGKSTLIESLTGINPDRLAEEQEREMTIDLGFAWITLPSGREVSVIDVPGHEDFLKNMLAGIGGIDLCLFVVAADEGIMPQTREHLTIVNLLRIPRGVVALTKSDLVDDPEWLELVQEEVREELQGTVLRAAEIVPVSAKTGKGLPELLAAIDRQLDEAEDARDISRPRMGIDRAFSISGFGTVVTGTLLDGCLRVGDQVVIEPEGLEARIRGLQMHKAHVELVQPGSRVAINLTGVDKADLRRGQVVVRPGWLSSTTLMDAQLEVAPESPLALKHNTEVEFFVGASRVLARVRLLESDALEPGQEGWVQYRFDEPLAAVRGDRYILRLPSPSVTIGGGVIVQTHPGRRHRRFRPDVISNLEALASASPSEVLVPLVAKQPVLTLAQLVRVWSLSTRELADALGECLADGRLVAFGGELPPEAAWKQSGLAIASASNWQGLVNQAREAVGQFHASQPLRLGMPREELRARLKLAAAVFTQFADRIVAEGVLVSDAALMRVPEHRIGLTAPQRRDVEELMRAFGDAGGVPPSVAEAERHVGADLVQYLIETGQLVKASDAVLYEAGTFGVMQEQMENYLREHGQATVAEVRDLFASSRKQALAFLEELDRRGVTKRLGDTRVLRRSGGTAS